MGDFNETNLRHQLLDDLGSDRDGDHPSGDNAVRPESEGGGTSTRGRYAAAYGRASRQGEGADRQRKGKRASAARSNEGLTALSGCKWLVHLHAVQDDRLAALARIT
jgi:hypothetical protein